MSKLGLLVVGLVSLGCNGLTGIDAYGPCDPCDALPSDSSDAFADSETLLDVRPDSAGDLRPDDGADGMDASDAETLDAKDTAPIDTGAPCTPSSGCSGSEYCDTGTSGCASGTCKPRPSTFPPKFSAACGCDGVWYWNAEHATSLGVSLASTSCSPTIDCGKCPTGTRCLSVYSTAACIGVPTVSCWTIPGGATCSGAASGPTTYVSCSSTTCLRTCDAVLGETAPRVWSGSCTP